MASPVKRESCDVSSELADAIAREHWAEVKNILSASSRHVADSVVTQLINEDQWSAVRQILECVEDKDRTWNIGGIVVKGSILLSVAKRDWKCLKELPNKRFPDSTFQWIIRQASTQATESEVVQFVLPHCADDRQDSVLTILVERHLWQAVVVVLKKKGVSDSSKRWVVLEVCACCESVSQEQTLYDFCADDQVDSVLRTLVERRQWRAVGMILKKKGVSDSNKQWAVQEACKHCKDYDLESLIQNILPHCADDQRDSVLTTLVERRLWHAVLYVLKRGVSDSSKRWVVLEVCACCESVSQEQKVSDFCADDQVDSVLRTLVERHLWWAAGVVLRKTSVSDSDKRWAVRETCKHREEYELKSLIQNMLPHCDVDQLFSVLTPLVERRLWQDLLYVLKRGDSDFSKRWVVLEACACYVSVVKEQISSEILLFCADDQVDCVLTTLVERHQWRVVGVILKKKGVSDSNKQWAVQEACKHGKDYKLESLIQNILPHCADDQLFSVLTTLVERRLWRAVVYVLKRGDSDSSKRWVVMEACACYESVVYEQIPSEILLFCADDQVDCVLTTLVERHLWKPVGELLQRGVSESQHRWALGEASKTAERDDLITFILPHCSALERDSVLPKLAKQHLWKPVGELLQRSVSESQLRWAVGEASKTAERDDFIPPYCFARERDSGDSVLPKFAKQHLWKPVGELLQQGVSESQHRWAVGVASKTAESDDFIHFILPHCSDLELDSVLLNLMKRHLWKPVGEILQRDISETQCRCVFEVASRDAESNDFVQYILPHCSDLHLDSVLTNLAKHKKFKAVDAVIFQHVGKMEGNEWTHDKESGNEDVLVYHVSLLPLLVEHCHWTFVETVLHSVVMKSLCRWAKQGSRLREDESVLLTVINSCRVNVLHSVELFKVVKKEATGQVRELHQHLGLTEDLCELLFMSLLHQVCVALCSGGESNNAATEAIENVVCTFYAEVISCISSTKSTNGNADQIINIKRKMSKIDSTSHDFSSNSVWFFLHVLQQFNLYYTRRSGDSGDYDDNVFLMVFALLPFSSELQSVALRIMLRQERWDVISHADLSGVWEQDRRHLLQAAVKQRQWSVVKRWADHTLYDDQRVWALNEALNEKQWGVALLLADHGLTDIDLMRVHYRLAKYADWDVILHMFERGADVAEVGERLGRMKDNKRISEESQRWIDSRLNQVRTLEKTIQNAKADALENACRGCNWIFVLYTLLRNPSKESVRGALKVAMKKKAWHVVMQLVRIGMDAKQRHSLFSRMLKRQQWGVCRVLLEHGLRVQLCLKVLPQLMEMNQWALVARVMEHEVGDDVRQQVMKRAWERREGSLVWLCIKSLPTPLSREEREALFQRAFSCELWQVIKPLVEEKDETGIRHRDIALLEAIDLHEWDLVDHCQRHHADINMKDDDGHTPLQRAAKKKDWEAVEELVVRDGDPNLLDGTGCTVLHRVVTAKQWSVVKLLIEYQADIHKEQKLWNSEMGGTPLGMLIDARRVDIIDHSLFWCPDQFKGVNGIRETSLHVACVSGCYDSMYNLVARRVNPLAVTNTGQSALVYSVLNEDCPQRMVAECIRLGFSTHQPKLTNIITDKKCLNPYYRYGRIIWHYTDRINSPFLCALLRGLPVVAQMLYESGACSQRELFRLYTELPILADTNTDEGRKLQEQVGHAVVAYQNFVYCIEDITLPYLTEIATTPRSLVSTCRLVISHCLTLSKTRHRDVDQLPLTERMKNFVLFSDLTDPDFGKDTT